MALDGLVFRQSRVVETGRGDCVCLCEPMSTGTKKEKVHGSVRDLLREKVYECHFCP